MTDETETVDVTAATVQIVDGRVTMDAGGREETTLRVRTPERRPLTRAEVHANLTLTGDDFSATVSLDADAVDALAEALPTGSGGQ